MDKPIRVADVKRFGGDIMVYFSNGTSAIYHAKFLYDMRNHDSNIAINEGA